MLLEGEGMDNHTTAVKNPENNQSLAETAVDLGLCEGDRKLEMKTKQSNG